jgi:hypothetical protein
MFYSLHPNLSQSRKAAKGSIEQSYALMGGDLCQEFFGAKNIESNADLNKQFIGSDLGQQGKNLIGYDWLNDLGSLTAPEPKQRHRSGRRRLLPALPQ